jgi:small-conductance mechanosensitive channel
MRNALQSLRNLAINEPMELVLPVVTFAVVFVIGLVLRRLVLRGIKAWNGGQQSRGGRILYEALRGPLMIWSLMLALHLALQSSDLPARYTATGAQILFVLWVFSLTIMLVNVVGDIVRFYGAQVPGAVPVTTLTQTLAQIVVLVLGVTVLLAHYEVKITPILTALGVGGLAVALALQDTLSNLFGGFYVAVAGQVRLGDYIKLNTGEEGYVTDIGWRVTTLRALANNLIIVPNSKLSQAIVTNYNLPDRRLGASFGVTVGYDCDLEQVEQALGAVLKEAVGEVPGLVAEPAPSVAFDPGFGENGMGLTVNYQVEEFASQTPVRNALRRRTFNKFKQLGINVPYPSRTVYLRGALSGEQSNKNLQPHVGDGHQ